MALAGTARTGADRRAGLRGGRFVGRGVLPPAPIVRPLAMRPVAGPAGEPFVAVAARAANRVARHVAIRARIRAAAAAIVAAGTAAR